jgi:hypothetical protein
VKYLILLLVCVLVLLEPQSFQRRFDSPLPRDQKADSVNRRWSLLKSRLAQPLRLLNYGLRASESLGSPLRRRA